MQKVKLFRKGKPAGIVRQDFHYTQERKVEAFWDELEISQLRSR
jgi:hypothetical protein